MTPFAKATYFTGFDVLRFYAAISVIVGHATFQTALQRPLGFFFLEGGYAVVLFFVLSGFLITHLLIEERGRTGRVDLPAFYARRALRIWPLYFVVLGMAYLFFHASLPIPYLASFMLFLGNISVATLPIAAPILPLWSIGAEEQFYTLWGYIMSRRQNSLIPLLVGVVIFRLGLIVFSRTTGNAMFQWAVDLNRFDAMAMGCIAAFLYHQKRTRLIYRLELLWWGMFVAVVLLPEAIPSPFADTALACVFAGLIVCVGTKPQPRVRLPNSRLLGSLSFGLYLWHYPISLLVGLLTHNPALLLGVTLVITLLVSGLSLWLVERPFLRLKSHFQPRPIEADVPSRLPISIR